MTFEPDYSASSSAAPSWWRRRWDSVRTWRPGRSTSVPSSGGRTVWKWTWRIALLLVTVMWGFSAWWLLLAVRIIVKERRSMHFHLGWWGFGFPSAAFVNLTAVVARQWQLDGIIAIDAVLWVAVLAVIATLIVLTLRGLRSGATWAR